jgi:acyl transferase domain-containing protein
MTEPNGPDIAVVGYSCRFPGAPDAEQFWRNLRDGVESVTVLSDREIGDSGVDRATRRRPGYVRAAPVLDDVDKFDAEFFGFSPREARLMDPQHRLFLQCAWHAVEHAGYDPDRYDGSIGVFAGSALNTYLLWGDGRRRLQDDYLFTVMTNDKDFLTSRVSYQLGLTGPSVTVQTACSTSLVAVHLAAQSLLTGECDMALAGGVSVRVPHRAG